MKYIAILRGINVGGKRKIPMAELREKLGFLGFKNVKTYIQSGNIIFSHDKEKALEIATQLEEFILDTYGFQVPVIIRSAEEIAKAISENPFLSKEIDIERLHLTFLKQIPDAEKIEKAKNANYEPDDFKVLNNNVFIYCSGKYSDSKLTNKFFEDKFKVSATTRNWKTVLKLASLATEEN
ncbi:DUF1697 domain-containing protein [Zunongwangia sp. F363]|uniref:DUF1697 domain-containing protein n=1 Tax=Autumnicola tepida TaxID=3075595 RepID=A0ABU3CC57_9FLAO|nr:DUF1697 domain-containing protein [Zunongwangia sp. F363]MDT0643925.1 DUF1697 domain-containing protein [Zunongwangia sp. F363]